MTDLQRKYASLSEKMRKVYDALRDIKKATPKEVALETGLKRSTVASYVNRLQADGLIEKVSYGVYQAVPIEEMSVPEGDRPAARATEGIVASIIYTINGKIVDRLDLVRRPPHDSPPVVEVETRVGSSVEHNSGAAMNDVSG